MPMRRVSATIDFPPPARNAGVRAGIFVSGVARYATAECCSANAPSATPIVERNARRKKKGGCKHPPKESSRVGGPSNEYCPRGGDRGRVNRVPFSMERISSGEGLGY